MATLVPRKRKMAYKPKMNLEYLNNKPVRIYWDVVAGGKLSEIQMSDLVYDDFDCKIRQIKNL